MNRTSRRFPALLAAVLAAAIGPGPCPAQSLRLDLEGHLNLPGLPGAPVISWKLAAGADAAQRASRVAATAPGLSATVWIVQPAGDAPGRWVLEDASVSLAEWWRAAAAASGTAALPPDLGLAGTATLRGEGGFRGLVPDGRLLLSLSGGSARSESMKWALDDLRIEAEFELRDGRPSLETLSLRAGSGSFAGIAAVGIELDAVGSPDGLIEVRRSRAGVFGGMITVAPFRLDPARPSVGAAADFAGFELAQLATLVPQALSGATGRVSGRVLWGWSPAAGFRPTGGEIRVLPEVPASITLSPSPGLLTQGMPLRLTLLPRWLGPLGRLEIFQPENPAYLALSRMEMGLQPLSVDGLSLELYPDGPDGPRSARVAISAHADGGEEPAAGRLGFRIERPNATVTFGINVAGPLQQVIQLGLDRRATLDVR